MSTRIKSAVNTDLVIETALTLVKDARNLTPEGFNRDVKLGHVYVLEGEEGEVKIGCSVRPRERLNVLRRSGGIDGTREYISKPLLAYYKIEHAIHESLDVCRLSGEWFRISFEQAKEIVEEVCNELVLPDDEVKQLLAEQKMASDAKADKIMDFIVNRFDPSPSHPSDREATLETIESRLGLLEDNRLELHNKVEELATKVTLTILVEEMNELKETVIATADTISRISAVLDGLVESRK